MDKDSMLHDLKNDPHNLVGRSLVDIQTYQKEGTNIRWLDKSDARVGSIGAKQYLSKGRLEEWVMKYWTRPGKSGVTKICMYYSQLLFISKNKKQK